MKNASVIETLRERSENPKPRVVWQCEVCGAIHMFKEGAKRCGGEFTEPPCKVGDVVVWFAGYGWSDGKPHWTLPGDGIPFHGMKTINFWAVITALTIDKESAHHWRIHVQTLGMHNGQPGGFGFSISNRWNQFSGDRFGSLEIGKREPPALVVEESKALIGNLFHDRGV